MKFLLVFVISVFMISLSFAQDTMKLQGHYYGKNIFIINPGVGNDKFCVQKIMVNNRLTKDEINSNSFEIDFSLLDIPVGTELGIIIYHDNACKPKIVNPEVLQQQSTFSFLSAKVDKTGKIIWNVKGEVSSAFNVEQYRWKKWVSVGEVEIADSIKKNIYGFVIKPHFGPNQFRISHTDAKGNIAYSKIVKYRLQTAKELFISNVKVSTEIVFTGETAYEVFDEKGNFIMDGFGTTANIADLQKGKYWVNYDNKTEMVYKK